VNWIQKQEEEEASSEYFEEIAIVSEDVQIVKEQHERKAPVADVNETIDDEENQEFKEDHLVM
jgi:hypothetical protein